MSRFLHNDNDAKAIAIPRVFSENRQAKNARKPDATNCEVLTSLYHTVPSFHDPNKECLRKHCGKRRKFW